MALLSRASLVRETYRDAEMVIDAACVMPSDRVMINGVGAGHIVDIALRRCREVVVFDLSREQISMISFPAPLPRCTAIHGSFCDALECGYAKFAESFDKVLLTLPTNRDASTQLIPALRMLRHKGLLVARCGAEVTLIDLVADLKVLHRIDCHSQSGVALEIVAKL